LSLDAGQLSPAALSTFKHAASMVNPKFYELQRLRKSTWDTPRFVRGYDLTLDDRLVLPRGLRHTVARLVEAAGSRLALTDLRNPGREIEAQLAAELNPDQTTAVSAMLAHDDGVLVAPPGSGKTVMACAVIAERGFCRQSVRSLSCSRSRRWGHCGHYASPAARRRGDPGVGRCRPGAADRGRRLSHDLGAAERRGGHRPDGGADVLSAGTDPWAGGTGRARGARRTGSAGFGRPRPPARTGPAGAHRRRPCDLHDRRGITAALHPRGQCGVRRRRPHRGHAALPPACRRYERDGPRRDQCPHDRTGPARRPGDLWVEAEAAEGGTGSTPPALVANPCPQ
jgi:hypothetical protein